MHVEIATNPRIEEPKNEVILDFMDEECTVTLEYPHDTEIIEVEPQQQNNYEVKQDVVTQEPASLNFLAHMAIQMREGEPGIEGTQEFNEEIGTMTPGLSQDTKILEMESQQQGDEEVNQDVAT